jgi:hypothetical protein
LFFWGRERPFSGGCWRQDFNKMPLFLNGFLKSGISPHPFSALARSRPARPDGALQPPLFSRGRQPVSRIGNAGATKKLETTKKIACGGIYKYVFYVARS